MPKCWICGDEATSGEHMAKRTDLKQVFAPPNERAPLYLSTRTRQNQRVSSFDSRSIKLANTLCHHCNTTRTQPYDRAWAELCSYLLQTEGALTVGRTIRTRRIFKYDTIKHLVDAQLFLVKLWGCHLYHERIAKQLTDEFAACLMAGKHHPDIYLRFGVNLSPQRQRMVGIDDAQAILDRTTGACLWAVWPYYVNKLVVVVIFARSGYETDWTAESWHPAKGTTRIRIHPLKVVDE